MSTSVIRQDGEGEQLWFAGGGLFTMKATSAETGGTFALFEDREVLGKPTPLHVHPGDDEVLYVLEGEILVHVDGQEHRVGEGGVFVAPRGVPHAFLVTSENAATGGSAADDGTRSPQVAPAPGRPLPSSARPRAPASREPPPGSRS